MPSGKSGQDVKSLLPYPVVTCTEMCKGVFVLRLVRRKHPYFCVAGNCVLFLECVYRHIREFSVCYCMAASCRFGELFAYSSSSAALTSAVPKARCCASLHLCILFGLQGVQNVARVRRDANDTNIASQALISSLLQRACCRDLMVQIDKKKCNTFSQRVEASGGAVLKRLALSVSSRYYWEFEFAVQQTVKRWPLLSETNIIKVQAA